MTTRQKLLQFLGDGQVHSGEELAKSLGLSRAAIWKQIHQFKELGVAVSARPGQGYQLDRKLDLLSADKILDSLGIAARQSCTGLDVLWMTESTNLFLAALSPPLPGHFHVCAAEFQTAGKGRRGREWLAPFGDGICLSFGWNFATSPPSLACLGLAVGVGVLRALSQLGLGDTQLKWPNDILRSGRKLAGILIEVKGESEGPLHVIAGIGINYHLSPELVDQVLSTGGIEPSAIQESHLADETPQRSNGRNRVVALVIDELYKVMIEFSLSGFGSFINEWQAADYLFGKPISVITDAGEISGTASGVSADGQLQVKTKAGIQHVLSGDVQVRAVA